jgi:hypothetical protein
VLRLHENPPGAPHGDDVRTSVLAPRREHRAAALPLVYTGEEGLELVRVEPGDVRRERLPIAAVKDLLDHASVNTMIYDRRGERKKRKAASLVHVPYVRADVRR